ncbi:SLAM family member 5-like [Misgurnus anguillicaudatus]|uniref:SLAM family member 5-like n=1 Tax=Misgurnus anguillicaudatus TaxID=75329 RepID=UPI003CCFB1BF
MEGDSVTLQTDLIDLKSAHLILWRFGPQESLIARVNREANTVSIYDDVLDGRFRDRLQVNNQTGDLIITNITTQHTGLYQINISGKQKSSHRFDVTVYARLHVPVISSYCLQNSSSVSNCLLLCSVMNARDVSLSWYKGNSLLSLISVSDLNIRLSLPLEVEYQDNNTYSCVVNNPIGNQTQHLNITHLCQTCSDCVSCCDTTEVVIRLVISALVAAATVAVLAYDVRSSKVELKKRSKTARYKVCSTKYSERKTRPAKLPR